MSEEKNTTNMRKLTLRIGFTAILIAVGVILSYINPFGYFTISGTKINPFAHLINAISGVLLGISFSVIAASSIAVIRYSTGIHQFSNINSITGISMGGLFTGNLRLTSFSDISVWFQCSRGVVILISEAS